jgi:dinuclear metal center YbgI/SA1388 family protein
MNVSEVVDTLQSLAPLDYAEEWDNVGLLVGSTTWSVDSILLTIDLTQEVMDEATDAGVGMIVSYHPPIFGPLKALTDRDVKQKIVLQAAAADIAIYSPHTALDAAPEGVNDWLASCVGQGDVRALRSHDILPQTEQCKVITFCPAEAVDTIRNGLAAAGAGRIGNYQLCSFEIDGRGTFLAGENTKPAVGRRGSLQRVDEVRLEMVCPRISLALAVIALREFHPYEEPPIEVHPLLGRPQRHIGAGRRVTLDQPTSLKSLVGRIKEQLGVRYLQVAQANEGAQRFERIGLCAGAGGSLLEDAIAQECTLYLTGELRHHDVLSAQARGCTVILAGHTNTERGYLKVLRKRMNDALESVSVIVSKRDADPLTVM